MPYHESLETPQRDNSIYIAKKIIYIAIEKIPPPNGKVFPKPWNLFSKSWNLFSKVWNSFSKLWKVELYREEKTFPPRFRTFSIGEEYKLRTQRQNKASSIQLKNFYIFKSWKQWDKKKRLVSEEHCYVLRIPTAWLILF